MKLAINWSEIKTATQWW